MMQPPSAAGESEEVLYPSDIQNIVDGDDIKFEVHLEGLLRVCLLDRSRPLADTSTVQQLLCLQWVISPLSFPDHVLVTRPCHRKFIQEVLTRGVVTNIINLLCEQLKAAGMSEPPEQCIHAVSALLGITQRFQLATAEAKMLLGAFYHCLQILEGHSTNSQSSAIGSPSTVAGATAVPRLRFPSGTPGALIEDVAYLLSLSLMNVLRISHHDSQYLWPRDLGRDLPDLNKSNRDSALLQDQSFVDDLKALCVKTQGRTDEYILEKIAQVGQGNRRSREEAAGYYAMVLIGVSGFLIGHKDQSAQVAGLQALRMCCGSMITLTQGCRVLARCSWKGGSLCRGVIRGESEAGLFIVKFDEGEEEHVPSAHIKIESTQQLIGRGWMRVREWFPTFYSCGMGAVISQECIQQGISAVLDCWLAETMPAIVDELIPAEQEEYRAWEESTRQLDNAANTPSALYQHNQYPEMQYSNSSQQQSGPLCNILIDVMRAIAFTLQNIPQEAAFISRDKQSPGWRDEMVGNILDYNKNEALIQKPRAGTALFFRFVRKAHGSQGPIAWLIESSPGRQGDLDSTALSCLAAYVEICTSLCLSEEACLSMFQVMQSDSDSRSTFHVSLRFIMGDPDGSVLGSFINGTLKWSDETETFLCAALNLTATLVSGSDRVRNAVSQLPELTQTCFVRLFSLLDKGRSLSGKVIGKIFTALAAWCDGHDNAINLWLKIYKGGVLQYPIAGGGFSQNNNLIAAVPPMNGQMGQSGVMNGYGYPQNQIQQPEQPGGMEYEIQQERRLRQYPQTLGFLHLIHKLLSTINWRTTTAANPHNLDLPINEIAAIHVSWTLESVLSRWDEQRYDNLWERWYMAILILRIIKTSLHIPDMSPKSPYGVVWSAIVHGDLLRKIMSTTLERRERECRTGAIMDNLLAESLSTIHCILKSAKSPSQPINPISAYGSSHYNQPGQSVAQDIVDWDNGGLVMKLASEEWHGITLNSTNPNQISQLCLNITLELAAARCRLSHHFIVPGRGRPEDITRDAEETILEIAKSTHRNMSRHTQLSGIAGSLDRYFIRPVEAGVRVSSLLGPLKRYLIGPLEGAGQQREALEAKECVQVFIDNKAEQVQEVLAAILDLDNTDDSDVRPILVCDIINATLQCGTGYYNLAHILCGIPERYVDAKTRGAQVTDEGVLRPYGCQRMTCLSVLVEKLSRSNFVFVKVNPVTASHFLRVLSALASDRVIGSAVLRYLRSINLVDRLMGLLKERLSELPAQPSASRDPSSIGREFGICAAILQLAALELFTNHDANAQNHLLKMLVTTRELHRPLLLEAIRSLDMDSLPVPPALHEMLAVPVPVVRDQDIPRYSIEDLENLLGGAPGAVSAVQLAVSANNILSIYPRVAEYVEAWCRLTDVTLVIMDTEPDTGGDKSTAAEIDEVLFQTLLTLVNQMASNLGRSKVVGQSENVIDRLLTRQKLRIDTRLSRTALALIDVIRSRAGSGSTTTNRSAEQLGHLLRPLLQCLCDANDTELRTNLYTVLTAFLYHVEYPAVEGILSCGAMDATSLFNDRCHIKKACQDELLRSPFSFLQRMLSDIANIEANGTLTTTAWTTLTKAIEWDTEGQLVTELHGSNIVSQHLANYDNILCQILHGANHGDMTGSQYLGGYQAFMTFLLAYANSPGGARILTEQHGLLYNLKGCKFLEACGDGFPSTSELMQERCAQIALPALRMIAAVVQRLTSDHSVMVEVRSLLNHHTRLFEHILRRPYNLSKSQDGIDMPSLSLLECTTRLFALYAGSAAQSTQDIFRLVQQFQLKNTLADFCGKAVWAHRVVSNAPQMHPERYDGGDSTDAVKDEANFVVTGIVLNILTCMRRACAIDVNASTVASAMSGEMQPIFQLTIHDPEGLAFDTLLSRADLTVLLCTLRDIYATSHHLLKTHPNTAAAGNITGNVPPERLIRASQVDALLIVTHHSAANALLLLLYHLRGISEGRFKNQAQQHVEPLLRDTMEYVQTFTAANKQDSVTTEVMNFISAIVKVTAEVLRVSVSRSNAQETRFDSLSGW